MAIEPRLEQVVADAHESRLLDLHVSLPGAIVDYDRDTQTATVQPVVQRPIAAGDGSTTFEDLPPIPNVRVAWPRGGGYSIQWPLIAGDCGELVFTQWDPSNWRENGQAGPPALLQLHGLSQPFFIPGAGIAPLTPPVGDEAVFEIGGVLRLGGLTADYVALSTKVDAMFTALAGAFTSWTPVAGDGGAALKTLLTTLSGSWPTSTAAVKVKAE